MRFCLVSSWLCHVDDDIYVNLKVLVKTLAVFDPKTELVYFGRAGTEWGKARQVSENSTIGRPGQRYHFAVGGMYCLSRAMLERAKPYLVWVLRIVASKLNFVCVSSVWGNCTLHQCTPPDVASKLSFVWGILHSAQVSKYHLWNCVKTPKHRDKLYYNVHFLMKSAVDARLSVNRVPRPKNRRMLLWAWL